MPSERPMEREEEIPDGNEECSNEKVRQHKVDTQVFTGSVEERRNRNERNAQWHAQEREQRRESNESQASHRHRLVEGEKSRRKGAASEILRLYRRPGRLRMQKTACMSTIAPAAAMANLPRDVS